MPEEFLPLIKEVINESDDAFCLIDKANKIIFSNQKLCDLVQLSNAELSDLNTAQLFTSEVKFVNSANSISTTLQQKTGCIPVIINVRLLGTKDLALVKVKESDAVDYKLKFQKSNKELEQFAYIISHDLNAPLRAINNLSEWIEDDLADSDNEDLKQFLVLLKSRVSRMQGLITGVLDYSRAGRIKDAEEEVDVQLIIQEIERGVDKPGFTIEVKDPLPVIHTVRKKLVLIFTHLIDNAFRHNTNDTGVVQIGYKPLDEGQYEFYVKDDGPGISPEHQEKIFVIFQTLESKDKVDTTGAGLAIVKKIVEDNDCEIKVDSDKGKGAKFIFTWK